MGQTTIIAALLASLLGIAVSFGLLVMRAPSFAVVEEPEKVVPSLVPKDWDFWTAESGSLSEELLKERKALKDRAKDLDAWQKQIEAEKSELVRVREQIAAIRDEIDRNVITLMEAEKPNLKNLSRSYAMMKAPQAVAIFRKSDDDLIVKLLSLMKPDTVAAILAEMATDTPSNPQTPRGLPDDTSGSARVARITEMLRLLKQENAKKDTQ